ncbi:MULTISPECIES: TetR/AcrR family transcriptional regulator [Mycobacterium]|uniref:TetR/AcrR family transcriptional regulator n=1 Tax=Mycobacterium TaxID=1763 RepID=UPI001EEF9096|nr:MULTISPECIES: TetR/AcrR family transcriptional regulator [Mycobacterium]
MERTLVATLERLIADEPRFTELTLERLVTAAGISRTSFYKYFDSKVDVLASWLGEFIQLLDQAPRTWSGVAAPTRAGLAEGMRKVAAVYRPRLPLVAAVYETAASDAELRSQLAAALESMEGALRQHISRGQQEGWANAALDDGETARWLIYLTENGLRHIIGPAPERGVRELVEAWADTVWFTLYQPAGSV